MISMTRRIPSDPTAPAPQRRRGASAGFTLIELMVTVAIVAILTAIALPSYRNYVLRGYLVDATNQLATFQAQMERYYQDNRTYSTISGTPTIYSPCDSANTATATARVLNKFTLSCTTSATAYTLTSTGTGPVAGFVYTVDNNSVKTTTISSAFPGWSSSTSCWVTKTGAQLSC